VRFDLIHLQTSVWPLLERAYGLPAGILGAIARVETGGRFDARALNPGSGAAGLFQLTPIALAQVQQDSGVRFDPYSPGAASAAAALLLRRYLRMFNGDVSLALAAYNAGEGRVKRFINEVRERGSGRLPVETARYIPKVLGAL
jgi:soluble lytic murein transglycosylase-like protein